MFVREESKIIYIHMYVYMYMCVIQVKSKDIKYMYMYFKNAQQFTSVFPAYIPSCCKWNKRMMIILTHTYVHVQ